MNSKDSKALEKVKKELETEVIKPLSAFQGTAEALTELGGKVSDAKGVVEAIRDEAGEKYDNMSEKAQEGEKGQELSGNRDRLDEAVTLLEEAETALQEEGLSELSVAELGEKTQDITEQLEEAIEKLNEL